jgi:hypothetical protein
MDQPEPDPVAALGTPLDLRTPTHSFSFWEGEEARPATGPKGEDRTDLDESHEISTGKWTAPVKAVGVCGGEAMSGLAQVETGRRRGADKPKNVTPREIHVVVGHYHPLLLSQRSGI